ncbi:BolA family transcriptional regulator [Platysternon megacephalum]|uniref:BolA family transcriptional regulator n=1 Tax=Platysternon megacephalum TaxID=55544 RepID=A0A4D9DIF3_9SAUR|nr:BolA family transcriptional regulator [Platysternon megacephalum]
MEGVLFPICPPRPDLPGQLSGAPGPFPACPHPGPGEPGRGRAQIRSGQKYATAGEALRCYTCLFPTLAPLDCLKFVTPCAPTQRCLTSVARGRRGALELVVFEKSCGEAALCGARGTRWLLGANFTYSTACCSSDLCNGGARPAWGVLGIALPLALLL